MTMIIRDDNDAINAIKGNNYAVAAATEAEHLLPHILVFRLISANTVAALPTTHDGARPREAAGGVR